jgi:hypothetical protein
MRKVLKLVRYISILKLRENNGFYSGQQTDAKTNTEVEGIPHAQILLRGNTKE